MKVMLKKIVLVPVMCLAGLLPAGAMLTSTANASAENPVLLAQELNGLVADMHCGQYHIQIRFVGPASSDQFSYTTNGLHLNNGVQEGDTYTFYNNDFGYVVTAEGGGTGSLVVTKYGGTILSKSCTWR